MVYSKKKTLLILRMNCIKYRLGSVNVWENRFFIIQNIRMKKLYDFLSQHGNLDRDTMRFIIDCLRAENTSPRYKYRFVQVFSMLFSVVIGLCTFYLVFGRDVVERDI